MTHTRYDIDFKKAAIQRLLENGMTTTQLATELGVNVNSIRAWKKQYLNNPEEPFVGSGNLHEKDAIEREKDKRIRDLEEENAILKKAVAIFAQTNNRKR